MTELEVIEALRALDGVTVTTVEPGSGAPEAAWGDTFAFYGAGGDGGGWGDHLATVITKDQPGDDASGLDAPGAFRLNVGVGRERFEALLGYGPEAAAARLAELDLAARDVVLPHPVYAAQGWVAVICPGERTEATVRSLLVEAHARLSS